MQQLQFVELDEGGRLVLTGDDGTQYAVVVDDRLRAALRPRPRQSDGERPAGRSASPRDVQAMIRAGQPAEDVAASTGWELDRVRRFEGPVLAEREHVVGLAQRAPVRASGRTDGSHTLDRRVRERLQSRGVDLTAVTWDAARGEAHEPWTVIVAFGAGGRERRAAWHYDVRSRSVEALDDEARWLSEDEQSLPGGLAGHPLLGGHHGEDEAAADLMATMRERRQRRGRGRRTPTKQTQEDPSHVPGSQEMPDEVLPLEDLPYDPDTMGDPPAAHPRGSAPEAAVPVGPEEDDDAEIVASEHRAPDTADDAPRADRAEDSPGTAAAPATPAPEPEVVEPMSPEEAQRAVGRSPGRKRRRLRLPSLGGDHTDESQEPEGTFARTRHDPQEVTFDEFFGVEDEDDEEIVERRARHEVHAPSEDDDVREEKPPTLVAVEDPETEDNDLASEDEAWDVEDEAWDDEPAADDAADDEDVQDDLPQTAAHAAQDEAGIATESTDADPDADADSGEDDDDVADDVPSAQEDVPSAQEDDVEDVAEAVDDEPVEKPAAKPSGRKGRTSVPSWDDIMFGSRPPRG